ncbi:hypothetical protein SLEP1_g33331 [Rubroshorea leprosula]|uniref:Glycosyltransferase 61 catalytic domain-containing protein n=1 Tax=Rubroshorea leprosula TaxID=152421 RepID=A0AAV5KG93_9ROSI|nr:hypothetical protein SLEP1_g33331 [Rubroshorea leprosula]
MTAEILYDSIFARSFNRYEQKKFGYGAMLGCLFIALSFWLLFNPQLGPLSALNLRLSVGTGLKMLSITDYSAGSLQMLWDVNETSSSKIGMINSTEYSSGISGPYMSLMNETSSSQIQMMNYTGRLRKPTIDERVSSSLSPLMNNISSYQKSIDPVEKKSELVCTMEERTDVCEINGDIRIDPSSSSVFIVSSDQENSGNSSWTIKPYARKGDEEAMKIVRQWSVTSVTSNNISVPQCSQSHNVPAILFSTGGYAGNNFHDFTDVVVPLFLTARKFNGEVKFLITNRWQRWVAKFQKLLENLSRYEFSDIDNEKEVHCFPSVIIGLKRHPKELKIDPSKSPYSMRDFRVFLRNSYPLKKSRAIKMSDGKKQRPRLLIISRKRTRTFMNTEEIARAARRLGFKVVVAEPDTNMSKFSEIVNSCDVLMGVHGAGLTNMVFLPEHAVLIQVVPFGGFEWLAKAYFEEPSKDMNLRYLEYKIKTEESSLIQEFPAGHEILSNPISISKQGWYAFKSVYLDKQNVRLDVNRFRPTLLKALELLHQ